MNYDLISYSSHALVAVVGIISYDVFVDGKSFSEQYTMDDAIAFGLSSFVSSLVFDVVSGLLPYLYEKNMIGMVAKPLLNGLVYLYLYEYMLQTKYQFQRDNKTAFFIGAIGNVILSYVNNPLLSLFSGMKNY